MFFDRSDNESCAGDRRSVPDRVAVRRGGGAMALALAVAAAAPVVCLSPRSALANTELDRALLLLSENARATDPELLSQGIEQLNKGQYEAAQTTLQLVKMEGLSKADQDRLTGALTKVESALMERKNARAAFEAGEKALEQKNYSEALKQYETASANQFADSATKAKSQSQIQVARAAMGGSAPVPADTGSERAPVAAGSGSEAAYKDAYAEYKAGNLEAARAKFAELSASGYKPKGMFKKSPTDFVRDIDRELARRQRADDAAAAAARVETQPPAETTANESPATRPAEVAVQPPPDAGVVPAPSDAGVAPAADAGPSPREAYSLGVQAYDRRDYEAARRYFEIAQNAGYEPKGLFKKSPAEFLRRLDREARSEVAVAPDPGAAPSGADSGVAPGAIVTPPERGSARDQRSFEAQRLVAAAREAERDNRNTEAYRLYAAAVEADPANTDASAGTSRLAAAGGGGGAADALETDLARRRIIKDAVRYRFDQAIMDANTAITGNDFARAQAQIDAARVAADSRPEYFTAEELNQMSSQIAAADRALARAREQAGMAEGERVQEDVLKAARDEEIARQNERQRTVRVLVQRARQLIYDGQYSQALGVINQIIAIDPTNEYAIGVKELVQDYALIQEQRRLREKHDLERIKQLNATEEKKIPYMDILSYPTNWPDISELRDREVMAERQGSGAEDLQVRAQLEKVLPEIRFDAVPFADVVEFLRDVSGANVFVNWRTLEAAGIERTAPVSARLRNIKFSKALETILSDVGGGSVQLSYTVDDGVITISTAEDLNKNTAINVYDIRDLLVIAPDFDEPPDFNLANESNAGTGQRGGGGGGGGRGGGGGGRGGGGRGGGGGGGGGGGLFGGGGGGGGTGQSAAERTEELITEIQTLIKETVDRESWVDNGGRVGQLKFLQGQLIVTQTPENHRQLVSLLDKLRESKAIQVSIETRFLTVQRNFLEDVGVDLDFFFNLENPDKFSPIGIINNSAQFTANPVTPTPGSIGSTESIQPAMSISGAFLDDFQVNFLIRATQASINSTVLTAPRVTVFNGQRAFVVVAQQQAYVSDLEAVTGDGVGLFNPIIDTINSGVRLVVQPTVSADRKYVTLALEPQVAQLVDLVDFPVFGVVEEQDDDGGGGGDEQQVFSAAVQLPILDITAVSTIVSVPDGGTLLLGGQTLAGEIEVEEGVPILSKIPFIKRLFTNKSTAKDERVLLILVKPTIIIQREVEQQQFPLLGTRSTPIQ